MNTSIPTKKITYLFLLLLAVTSVVAQPLNRRPAYDISKEKVLYTVGYSHLDTQWKWAYPASIDIYLKNILDENFYLFEKYPDYVFSFTGSRRYKMMKEYYPELYKKVEDYIEQGRWYVSGSSVDEGEVNISSSESLIRQVLYGNQFFREEFGKESVDYMLPDCFGFVANVPSVWAHSGLLGFSTQKLTWRSAAGIPFNVGVWNGPDGKGIIAALNATRYTGRVEPHLDRDSAWRARMDENEQKFDNLFDYRYYGVGDMGGAPRENDVRNAIASLPNKDSKMKVVLTSSDQMYRDVTPELRENLPVYNGYLLLIEHSAGSSTSQAFMKRMNRKNEKLAKASEQMAAISDWYGVTIYPFEKINPSWELLLGSQMHDILPGTSTPEAYEFSWNDEFIAANGFSETLKNAVANLSTLCNTTGKGRSVLVYNPVAKNREDVVSIEMEYDRFPGNVQVFDKNGKALPTQITGWKNKRLQLLFLATVPSVGYAVYDVRQVAAPAGSVAVLTVNSNSLENEYYRVELNEKGDFSSIYDKKAKKELLKKPATLEFLEETPTNWPAWNMDWDDRQNAPLGYLNEDVSITVLEQGPVRVSLQLTRKGRNSEISQVISLSAGEAGKRIEVDNLLDWQSTAVSLKASFPLTVSNKMATYNLGVGSIERATNDSLKFEVPSKEWFDLTDNNGQYGVSILEDCKYASDKLDDNTLRLTLMFTPEANNRFKEQRSQDFGLHKFKYGIYGHSGKWEEAQTFWQGKFLNQPLLAFEVPKHEGSLGKQKSFLSINNPNVGLMAFKKKEDGDYLLVRVNELSGLAQEQVQITLPAKITDAYEVNGQEKRIADASFEGNKLTFDLSHFTLKSFAVKLETPAIKKAMLAQEPVKLDFNEDAFSFDRNRDDANFFEKYSYPAELISEEVHSEGVKFKMGSTKDGANNVLACNGQEIQIPAGYTRLFVLAAATKDTEGEWLVGDKHYTQEVQEWTGFIGQDFNREFAKDGYTLTGIEKPFLKTGNIAWYASHRHFSYPSANESYRYCYLFKYAFDLPAKATKIQLPHNPDIKIMAITVAKNTGDELKPLQALSDDFRDLPVFQLRDGSEF
ncbi:MAG: alpha-mannosidase [Draconibacterium sp.]